MENPFLGKKIGIWGFGKTGQSILSFLSSFNVSCTILESQNLNQFQEELLKGHKAQLVPYDLIVQFLELNDFIIASPGVDLSSYEKFKEKFITEVDLFGQWVKKPVIAVTGSAGKTTVVTLLTQLLNAFGKKAIAAGNIGNPMLDVLATQDRYDYIVLELSSFQLEYAQSFAPAISTILNIYPNHLDRHKNMLHYLKAKGRLLQHQSNQQITFLPMYFMEDFWSLIGKQKVVWVGEHQYVNITKELSDITCENNWNIILSILDYLECDIEKTPNYRPFLKIPEHRVEFVRNINGIDFYNDSKATIPAATLQAVSNFLHRPLILLLGGLSKGTDRSELIQKLPNTIKHIICFGAESEQLHKWCQQNIFSSSAHVTLEDGLKKAFAIAQPNDIVLLSPAGSSFDLFKNYEERGNKFKKLILERE